MSELKPIIDEIKSKKVDPNIEVIKSKDQLGYAVVSKLVAGLSWCFTVWNLPNIIDSVLELIILILLEFKGTP